MKYPSVMTLKFWFWMAFRLPAVLSGHSPPSLFDRYFKQVDPRLADFKSTVPLHMVESAASTTGAKLPLTEDEQRALEKYCEEETNRYQPVRQPGNSDTESEDLIGAKASGNKLFVRTGDGKPMEFYLEAGLPRPERCRLQALVVGHGGALVTNPARRRHVVTLGAGVPGSQLRKATSVRRDTFSIKFVDECVRKGRVVDLCPFRLQSTSRYNRPEWVNDVLLGWCAWSDLGVETAVPYSYFVGQLHIVLLSLGGGRLGFTREKDEALVRFVAEYGIRHIFPPVTGKLFWFWMASQLPAVLSGHSPPSLFDRFFEQVGPRLADFKSTVPLHLLKMASLFTGTRLPLTEDEQRALAKRKQEVEYRCQQVLWRRRRQLPFFAGDSCTEAGDLICATDSGNKVSRGAASAVAPADNSARSEDAPVAPGLSPDAPGLSPAAPGHSPAASDISATPDDPVARDIVPTAPPTAGTTTAAADKVFVACSAAATNTTAAGSAGLDMGSSDVSMAPAGAGGTHPAAAASVSPEGVAAAISAGRRGRRLRSASLSRSSVSSSDNFQSPPRKTPLLAGERSSQPGPSGVRPAPKSSSADSGASAPDTAQPAQMSLEPSSSTDGDASADTSRSSRRQWQAYSRAEEDVLVRRVLAEHAAGGLLGGRRVWQKIEDSGVLPGRSWQSLKEHWRRTAPRLRNNSQLTESQRRQLCRALRRPTGRPGGGRPPNEPHSPARPYTRAEDLAVLRFLREEPGRVVNISGRALWQDMSVALNRSGRSVRSWQSLKERFHKRIAPALHHEYNEVDSVFRVFLAAELGL
ncbi:uncharacterized protein LOC122372470 isoform X1 [Amphibalanus amphitrite]|nr:uncharacterized protein LOC122372470 isoform X1 [Amphibalanus amphitrite]